MFFYHMPITPAWKLALVKLFGRQYLTIEGGCAVTYYVWRGRTYITNVELR